MFFLFLITSPFLSRKKWHPFLCIKGAIIILAVFLSFI
ncbi:hypothetical protein B4134_2412 [Bacillus safensis]|nr:hypothetical protein B4107_2288 [Bacillus safensis]KIL21650.1 hypothetical protein B4134_2412 [Bacillus safensis]PYH26482.1 hypothetical protein US8_03111 [Bacillus altitudinis]